VIASALLLTIGKISPGRAWRRSLATLLAARRDKFRIP